MRRAGGTRGSRLGRSACWAWTALAVPALGIGILSPVAPGAARFAARLAAAATTLARQAPRAQPALVSASPFEGTPAVGALFQVTPGGLGRHFCTATVVASPVKDLVITAAHCVYGKRPGDIAFVPGYRNSSHPHGAWIVGRIVVDSGWQSWRNPNRDVAFLVVGRPGLAGVQDRTGGSGWAPAGRPVAGSTSSATPMARSGPSSAAAGRVRSGRTSCGSIAAATPMAPAAGRFWPGGTVRPARGRSSV